MDGSRGLYVYIQWSFVDGQPSIRVPEYSNDILYNIVKTFTLACKYFNLFNATPPERVVYLLCASSWPALPTKRVGRNKE